MGRPLGRYVILDELAAGGMARVHLGQLHAEGGFSRVVAIKVLHAQYAGDTEFRSMFLDEARLVARIRHPNVVSTLDVLADQGELFLVMDYVHGLPLSRIIRDVRADDQQVPIPVVVSILIDALEGLHAAHEVRTETGAPLAIVHRDVSPQNIMLANDGLARVVDFGVAHATERLQRTVPGQIKGKASYMAPEQATGEKVDRRADVYAASVVLWEALAGERLFQGETFAATILRHLHEEPVAPSRRRPGISPELDAVALRGLAKRPEDRFATAHEMSIELARIVTPASRAEVVSWLEDVERSFFAARADLLARVGRANPVPAARTLETDTLTDVPVERELATTRDDGRSGAAAANARRQRFTMLAALALLASAGAVAALVGRASRAEERTTTPETAGAPAATTPSPLDSAVFRAGASSTASSDRSVQTGGPLGASPAATPSSIPTVAGRSSRPTNRTSVAAPAAHASSAVSARPSQPLCCTPDGTLQLAFHDCIDNCKN